MRRSLKKKIFEKLSINAGFLHHTPRYWDSCSKMVCIVKLKPWFYGIIRVNSFYVYKVP